MQRSARIGDRPKGVHHVHRGHQGDTSPVYHQPPPLCGRLQAPCSHENECRYEASSTTGDMRRKSPGLMFLTAVAAKPGLDRTDLVRLQSQLGEAQANRRHEPQSLLGCC